MGQALLGDARPARPGQALILIRVRGNPPTSRAVHAKAAGSPQTWGRDPRRAPQDVKITTVLPEEWLIIRAKAVLAVRVGLGVPSARRIGCGVIDAGRCTLLLLFFLRETRGKPAEALCIRPDWYYRVVAWRDRSSLPKKELNLVKKRERNSENERRGEI